MFYLIDDYSRSVVKPEDVEQLSMGVKLNLLAGHPSVYWDWAAGNAGIVGGIASGLASGLMAFLVFFLGLKAERKKIESEKQALISDAAFAALSKMRAWLDCGKKIQEKVKESIETNGGRDHRPSNISMLVFPIADTLPEPEKLNVTEISFLASNKQAELFDQVINVQNWGHHLLMLSREFSKSRGEWDKWAMEVSVSHEDPNDVRGVQSHFDQQDAELAKIKCKKMDDLILAIMDENAGSPEMHIETLERYVAVCRVVFPSTFPDITIR